MKTALAAIVALCAGLIILKDALHWRTGDRRHASFRTVVVSVLILLGLSLAAQARPSPYPPPTPFAGDRYAARSAQMGADVARAVQAKRHRAKYLYPTKKRPPAARQKWRHAPIPAPRPLAEPGAVEPLSMIGGVAREAGRAAMVIGGRPAGCPHRYCGCGASLHLFGRIIPALNLAANWLRFPRAAPAPDMVAARRGHVFVLKRHIAGNTWLVHDSNSGRGRTRIHPRSIAGYTVVNPHGGAIAFRSPS